MTTTSAGVACLGQAMKADGIILQHRKGHSGEFGVLVLSESPRSGSGTAASAWRFTQRWSAAQAFRLSHLALETPDVYKLLAAVMSRPGLNAAVDANHRFHGFARRILDTLDEGMDLLDTWRVVPCGLAGFEAKKLREVPLIIRHAGSDLGRHYKNPDVRPLMDLVFHGADAIVTNCHVKPFFLSLGIARERLFEINDVPVDLEAFNPDVEQFDLGRHLGVEVPDVPVITYLGKVSYRSETKGVYELIEAAAGIEDDFRLLFVAEGVEMPRLREAVDAHGLAAKTLFMNFVPPWVVPSVIKRSICVVTAERNFPIPFHVPIVPKEVMAVGRCVIMSDEIHSKVPYRGLVHGETALVVDPLDIEQFRSTLRRVIGDPSLAGAIGANARTHMEQTNDFPAYVRLNEEIYRTVLRGEHGKQ